MELFAGLHAALGKPARQVDPPQSFLSSPEAKVDEDLFTLWQEEGWACYGGGLFWTVDPRVFVEIAKDWPVVPPQASVFARNAFGDLLLVKDGEVFRLAIQWGRLMDLGPNAYIFLNSTLKEPSLSESLLQRKLFAKVRKRLGDLDPDECYGLVPALVLGGNSDDPASYQRVKMREYLALLAQAGQS